MTGVNEQLVPSIAYVPNAKVWVIAVPSASRVQFTLSSTTKVPSGAVSVP